ncbi:MAG TPA: response regulator [Thermoanaerobaculia bacterium]|nr:response regulator [Thermoanaerobaculia bacterium]
MARILVVEDETIVAMDLAATLRRMGHEIVGMVGTGAAAISSADAMGPDLILMDIRLKGAMDGIETARAIRERRPIPVVFLTAHADVETVERSKAASPYAYLVKPFDESTLHRVIEVALHRAETERAEHKATLDALWQSEERFRLLVEAVEDYAIFMIAPDGRIASWNEGAERVTGFTAADAIGQSVTTLRPAEKADSARLMKELGAIRDQGPAEWDDDGLKKDGSRYIAHIYCAPMLDRAGEFFGYVSIVRDVTEQRNMQAQLVQAQRFESLGQLAGGIAHDFNNMLMVILSRCDILLKQMESEKHRQYIADIRAAAMKNRDLTQQLLAAARRQVLEPNVVDLNEVIRSAMQLLGPTLGEQIRVRTELQEPLWSVFVDPGKLHQVLMNLSINARDAMASGGSLTIESRNVRIDSSYARQHIGIQEGEYVSLVVSDTGLGIPDEIRDRIYDPFFTTKEPGRGTGLGLAVVRGIVEQTGGRIWMYSEEGRGTTFKIFLPRHTAGKPQKEVAEKDAELGGDETILLVEDEELLRAVVREGLEEHGYQVLEAGTPHEALEMAGSFGGTIHILLTDIIMPAMTGIALAERLATQRPDMQVIYMSGYSNHAVINQAALPTGVHYLEKPIPTNVLLRAIRDVMKD